MDVSETIGRNGVRRFGELRAPWSRGAIETATKTLEWAVGTMGRDCAIKERQCQYHWLCQMQDVHRRPSRFIWWGSSCSWARAFTSAWSWSLVLSMLLVAGVLSSARLCDRRRSIPDVGAISEIEVSVSDNM